jgi:hypothetical protein
MAWQGTESSSFWQKSCCSLSSVQRWGRLCSAHTRTNAGFAAFWGGRRTGNAPAPARTRIPNLTLAIEIQGTRVAPRAERGKKRDSRPRSGAEVRSLEPRSRERNAWQAAATCSDAERPTLEWNGNESWPMVCCLLLARSCPVQRLADPKGRNCERARLRREFMLRYCSTAYLLLF